MKIAVIGVMSDRQKLVIDKMIEEGHEVVYMASTEEISDPPDYCFIDEYTEFDTTIFSTAGIVRELKIEPNFRPQKPYYRHKERY